MLSLSAPHLTSDEITLDGVGFLTFQVLITLSSVKACISFFSALSDDGKTATVKIDEFPFVYVFSRTIEVPVA